MKFTTPGVLRQVLSDKVFPNKQATKVKHLVCFAFRKSSRQELLERDEKGKKAKNPKKSKEASQGRQGRQTSEITQVRLRCFKALWIILYDRRNS